MRSLHEILDSVLTDVCFDLGQDGTHDGRPSRSYASRPGEVVTADELVQMAERGGLDLRNAQKSLLICPAEIIAKIRVYLSVFLADYVDPNTGKIGYAFHSIRPGHSARLSVGRSNGLVSESSVTALDNLGEALIHGAALVGSQKLEELLTGWKEGEPVRYRTCAILNGLTIDESFTPIDGVTIEALPRSTVELPSFLPNVSSVGPNDYQMVESRSMVNGASPGPPPAAQARARNSRLGRWRFDHARWSAVPECRPPGR